MLFHYFDALAGAGKTRKIAERAHFMAAKGAKVLICQPSMLLIDRTMEDELERINSSRRYPVTKIHGETNPGRVVAAVRDHMLHTKPGGEILVITHAAFLLSKQRHLQGLAAQWVLIIDETLNVAVGRSVNLPAHRAEFLKLISRRGQEPRYSELTTTKGAKLLRKAMRLDKAAKAVDPDDDRYESLVQTIRDIASDYRRVTTLSEQYISLAGEPDGDVKQMTIFSEVLPNVLMGFRKVIIASALFKDSLMYRVWRARGVEFAPVGQQWFKGLRYTAHEHGDRMTIYYARRNDWSKSTRDRDVEDGVTVLDMVIESTKRLFGIEPWCWMGNVDMAESRLGACAHQRMPNSPHGLNSFQDFHNVAVFSALNATPPFFKWLYEIGIDGDEAKIAVARSTIYQAVMRCSVRNPASEDHKRIVVMDLATAEMLADLFPGAAVKQLPDMDLIEEGKAWAMPRQTSSDRERKLKSREAVRTGHMKDLEELNPHDFWEIDANPCHNTYISTSYRSCDTKFDDFLALPDGMAADANAADFDPNKYLAIYKSWVGPDGDVIWSRDPVDADTSATDYKDRYFYFRYGSHDMFIEMLRSFTSNVVPHKHDNYLVSVAHFAPFVGVDSARGLDNVAYLYGMWFDCDGGDLSHEQFAAMFPTLRMAIYSTHSSTAALKKWRVFIPTSHAMTPAAHRLILDLLLLFLREAGYRGKKELKDNPRIKSRLAHGFDESKYNAAALFYLPCVTPDEGGRIWEDYNDVNRAPLNVREWVEAACNRIALPPEAKPYVPTNVPALIPHSDDARLQAAREAIVKGKEGCPLVKQARIDDAIGKWRYTPAGQGHDEFFKLAKSLKWIGLDDVELRSILQAEAGMSGSNARDRRKEITDVIRSVNKNSTIRLPRLK